MRQQTIACFRRSEIYRFYLSRVFVVVKFTVFRCSILSRVFTVVKFTVFYCVFWPYWNLPFLCNNSVSFTLFINWPTIQAPLYFSFNNNNKSIAINYHHHHYRQQTTTTAAAAAAATTTTTWRRQSDVMLQQSTMSTTPNLNDADYSAIWNLGTSYWIVSCPNEVWKSPYPLSFNQPLMHIRIHHHHRILLFVGVNYSTVSHRAAETSCYACASTENSGGHKIWWKRGNQQQKHLPNV